MFSSPWIRKPDFKNIQKLDYEGYWKLHHGKKLRQSLKPRERIMLELIPRGSTVLDIGCGASCLPQELSRGEVEVMVADIAPTVIALHKARGVSGMVLDLEDTQSLSALGTYDYIILSEVLEHMRYPEDAIKALKTHSTRFILSVPNSAAYVFRYGLAVRGRFFTQWVQHPSEHLRFWSHTDFLDWLDAMGLAIERTYVADGFTCRGLIPWLPRLWKNFFGYRMVYVARTQYDRTPEH